VCYDNGNSYSMDQKLRNSEIGNLTQSKGEREPESESITV